MSGKHDRLELRSSTPREAALAILGARFGTFAQTPTGQAEQTRIRLRDYQREAVAEARRILRQRRGVIVADGVGLGKTFIALALIEDAVAAGQGVAVVTPAALRAEWERHLRAFRQRLGPNVHTRVVWLSHARLSRGGYAPDLGHRIGLVVVDEAHAFRSPATRRYRALAELCRGADVVLLTATPINNTLMDLYFQIRLFAGDTEFRDIGIEHLGAAFRAASDADPPDGATWIRSLLRALAIRRTRRLLPGTSVRPREPVKGADRLRFPSRAPPRLLHYRLPTTGPGEKSMDMMCAVESLVLAPFRLGEYGVPFRGRGGAGEVDLIRLALLKRLESSVAAFRVTVQRQLRYLEQFLAALERDRLLEPAEFRTLYATGDGDGVQFVLEPVALSETPARLDRVRLERDVRADQSRLTDLERIAASALGDNDTKLARLVELLDGELLGRKAVLFTEYRDTARYLWKALVHRGGVGLVDGSSAFLGKNPQRRRGVIERFAPASNGVRAPPPRERVDLLIATDVLAEGLNLQDASSVVSFDLPWNPVRIIQRVGRVDRLGSPHDLVHVYNFVPDHGLESLLGLMARLDRKIAMIRSSIGADEPVLRGEPPATSRILMQWAAGDSHALDEIEATESAPFVPIEGLRRAYRLAARDTIDVPESPDEAALCARVVDGGSAGRVLVACDVRGHPVWIVLERGRPFPGDAAEQAAPILHTALAAAGETEPVDLKEARRHARLAVTEVRRRMAAVDGATRRRVDASTAAARALLASLDGVPAGPDAATCRRADRLLAALATPLDAGTEAALQRALRSRFPNDPRERVQAVLAALESALGSFLTAPASTTGAPAALPDGPSDTRPQRQEARKRADPLPEGASSRAVVRVIAVIQVSGPAGAPSVAQVAPERASR